jgi:hypothetical protein
MATITTGFYTSSNIGAAVQTALNSTGPAGFTVTFNSTPQTITVSNASNFQLLFGSNTANSCASLLGFTNSNTTLATSATATGILNLSPNLSFNIQLNNISNIFNANSNYFTFVIPITVSSGGMMVYEPSNKFCQIATLPNSLNNIQIQVVDDSSRNIALLTDWYMILEAFDD